MNSVTRRDFLKLSAAAGLAAAAATPLTSLAATPPAHNPFQRAGKPRLLLSLAAYSFRDSFPTMRGKANTKVKPAEAIDMFKFVDYCVAQGCDGTELTTYFFAEESEEYLLKLRRHCYLRGMPISGTAIGNNFSMPKGPKLTEEIATTKKWIDRAAILGAPHIRVFAGNIPAANSKQLSRADADKIVIESLEECCDYAGKKGIFLGLENHDSIGSAATLIPMVKAIKSPWIGINLDSGNFRTEDPYKDFAECVPYTVNVQFKADIHAGKGKAEADFKRFTKILRDGGYQGWIALEYESANPSTEIPRRLKQMKELFAAS